jgi:outer membrane protein assembly factor BamB
MTKSLSFPTTFLPLLIALSAAHAASGDWAQWRGPNHDGLSTETGLLKAWPAGGPSLVWKATGIGAGFSTVAVVGSRVFTMGDKGERNFVFALNRADGKPLWESDLGKAGAPGWGGFKGPRCMPVVDGDRLFAVAQYGEMACLDAASGQVKWRKDYQKDFEAPLPEWGFAGMPLVDGDRVILAVGGPQGDLVALNKTDGAVVWKSQGLTDSIHYSSPIVAEIGGVRQYVQLTETSVAGVAAADGKLLWRADRKGRVAVIPTPIYHDHHVYVASGYDAGCNLFKITPSGGAFSVEQVYANEIIDNHHGGVLKVGDHVYGHSEKLGWTCQEFTSGKAVWQEKNKLGKGSLAYADGHLYLRAEDKGKGTVALIEATPAGYRETGRFEPPDRSGKDNWPHPVIAGGQLYLRDQDVLLCYDVRAK